MCPWDLVEAEVYSANNKLSSNQEADYLVNKNQADFSIKVSKHNKTEVSSKTPNKQLQAYLARSDHNQSVDYSNPRDKDY